MADLFRRAPSTLYPVKVDSFIALAKGSSQAPVIEGFFEAGAGPENYTLDVTSAAISLSGQSVQATVGLGVVEGALLLAGSLQSASVDVPVFTQSLGLQAGEVTFSAGFVLEIGFSQIELRGGEIEFSSSNAPSEQSVGGGSVSQQKRKKKYRVNGRDYEEHSLELVQALQEALSAEKEAPEQPKRSVVKVKKGTPVYRVEFPDYPKFEAQMHEARWVGNYEVYQLMREMLERQRELDEEEAIFALLH